MLRPTRRDIGALLAILLLVPGSPVRGSRQDSTAHAETVLTPYADKDAYLIYAILLESSKSPSFVIRSETDSWSGATPKNVGIKGDRSFHRVWGTALKDFASQYHNPRLLTRDIPIEGPYELVSQRTLTSIFKSTGGWNTFYERYPSSGGVFSFSAVGFDAQRVRAIVQMNHNCGLLCGYGQPHFFEKKDGKWLEVSVKASVTVWAS